MWEEVVVAYLVTFVEFRETEKNHENYQGSRHSGVDSIRAPHE
jgi:hypothetical protein